MSLTFIGSLPPHPAAVWDARWSHTSNCLVTCCADGVARVFSNPTEAPEEAECVELRYHTRSVRKCSFSDDDRYLSLCSFDSRVSIWRLTESVENGEPSYTFVTSLEGHTGEAKSCCWLTHPINGQLYIATCGRDRTVWVWILTKDESDFECVSVLRQHVQDVKHVLWGFCCACPCLFSSSFDDSICMYQEEDETTGDDWYFVTSLIGHDATVWDLQFVRTTTGDSLISCSDLGDIIWWNEKKKDLMGGEEEEEESDRTTETDYEICHKMNVSKRPVLSISAVVVVKEERDHHHTHVLVAYGSADNSIGIISNQTEIITKVNESHTQDVNSVCWNPQNTSILTSASDDGEVKLWKFQE